MTENNLAVHLTTPATSSFEASIRETAHFIQEYSGLITSPGGWNGTTTWPGWTRST